MAPSRNSGLQRLNERLALLRVGVDSMLRSSDLVALTIADAAHNGEIVAEFATRQKKTRKPVRWDLPEKTRAVLAEWLAANPEFGAPPPEFGRISSKEPRVHGGNLDNKELVAGSTLYLPVWVPGGLFSAGDGHGVQGDGEVCVSALEMCLTGTFTLILHKGGGTPRPLLTQPRAETPTHYITMGLNEDMDQAMKQALREMIAFICTRTNLSREQAYMFCSLAVDFHVTQSVNGEKGIHGLLRKGLLF